MNHLFVAMLLLPTFVYGHGGGTNSNGCHTNNKTGIVHCHNSKSSSAVAGKIIGISSFAGGSGNSRLILKIQKLLHQHGYQTGEESGIAGARTTMAIRLFQEDNNLAVTGKPSEVLLQQLSQ